MEIALVLSLLVLAIVLFATEKLSVEIVTLLLLIVLASARVITPEEAFAGFSSDFIIIIASVFIISAALEETGILDFTIVRMAELAKKSRGLMLFTIMFITGLVSAFMNNTTVTAMFITPLVGLSKRINVNASKLLMPLAYAAILGGTCTLIGTSTNIAVSGYIAKAGLDPIGMFEITGIGLVIFIVGIIYMMTIGQRMLPDNSDQELTEEYKLQKYLTEIIVMKDSPLVGQLVFASDLTALHFRILNIIRYNENFLPDFRTRIEEKDVLLVEGDLDNLMKVKETKGIEIMADVILEKDLQTESIRLAELMIPRQSNLINKTVKEVNFLQRFGLVVIAISRHGETLRSKIGSISLQLGDILLVQGAAERLNQLRSSSNVALLDEFEPLLFKKRKGSLVITVFLLAILLGTTKILPLSIAFLMAAIACIVFRCISTEKAYGAIDWRLLILIGGMTAFGTAMENSGAADLLAKGIVDIMGPIGKMAVLAGFVVLTVILTQPMSNAAAALVIVPVALRAAIELQSDPRTFAIAIMLSASISLVTPFEPACILVYSPGKYRFMDFIKIGSPLTLLLLAVILLLVPVFWPL
ncbi:SLC13 family permease [Pontibacter sp. BT310]|uniref:SLC13 family permease n=1 Tax=Pontibacter populi TaxID=890055 RepID=A0ABS6X7U4_9BACT|nr:MULTISPECIES: SLC13 family permease [Pontibacter]MBJ6116719.1 SLC13 family permease [Pontibacter sp. BT310]MBR0569143.1 SLC13 family permease [Microvirga sp. STS03]MBW3363573.1 SLC13 family permease [Pontibacter populi]